MQTLVAADNGPRGPLPGLHYVEIDVQVRTAPDWRGLQKDEGARRWGMQHTSLCSSTAVRRATTCSPHPWQLLTKLRWRVSPVLPGCGACRRRQTASWSCFTTFSWPPRSPQPGPTPRRTGSYSGHSSPPTATHEHGRCASG
jgi:hypothetical protein